MDTGKRVGPEAAFNANSGVEKSERAMESSSTGMGSKMKPLKPVTKFVRTAKSKIIKLGPNRSTMYVASPPCIPVGCYEPAIKTHLCTDYDTAPIGCKLGDKCHFAHGICEIGKPVFLTFDNDNPCSLASEAVLLVS